MAKAKVDATATAEKKRHRAGAEVFRQMGDPSRLQIIHLLSQGERNVGELCDFVGLPQPATSHHLALLRHGSIVEPRRDGKHNYYSLTTKGKALAKCYRDLGV